MAENVVADDAALTNVYVGRADVDAAGDRGWLLGHFKPLGDVRHSEDVEIKWGVHPRGDERAQWVTGEHRTALLILISGRFRVELPGRSVVLAEQGDYIVWGHGVDHSWHAEEESVVLTVRWPSVAGYAAPAPDAGGGQPAPGGHAAG
ncbi:cupin domain-containing protein [Planotetraspora mira]|uniref:signal peptidase I n=1 Tax=Planotetraspora mira TaxID=58121 RepID=UPI001EF2032A|nr:signal peptidase I [Planotetraspora mira]